MVDVKKKNRTFVHDTFWNMAAFMVYICSQQILLFPIMAKLLDNDNYASLILCITIMNIFCNVLGGQLGITHQLQKKLYAGHEEKEHSDFLFLMSVASLLITTCFPIILLVLKFDIISVVFITITVLLSNFRMYIRYFFRINGVYKHMLAQNLCYMMGIGIGIGILLKSGLEVMWLPLIIGEVLGGLFTLLVVPVRFAKMQKTEYFLATLKRYVGLGIADALTNLISSIDKLLIYPLLGAHSLAVYNSGAATSKVAALLVNPLNEVILVKLSKTKDSGRSKILKTVIGISLIAIFIIFVALIPVIYVLSYVLYRQYLDEICTIIVVLSLSCAIGFTSSVMKSFILRYAKSSQITICYMINVFLLVFFGVVGTKCWSLIGYAIAIMMTKIELWLSFVLVLFKCMKEENSCEKPK